MATGFILSRFRLGIIAQWAIFAVPLLLLIAPALYYSLDAPLGLLEGPSQLVPAAHKFDSASNFLDFLRRTFLEVNVGRFRPFFDVWNGLTWKLFGNVAWAHYFNRWLFLFSAVALFIAAFLRFSSALNPTALHPSGGSSLRVVPVILLAYLWLFFPNVPVVRTGVVELHTVFFLGLCNWAAALMLTGGGEPPPVRHHALFFLGFLGLVFSKEINVAPALWLLVCYWAWIFAKGVSGKRLLMGSMMATTLVFAIYKIADSLAFAEKVESYYALTKPIDVRFPDNATDIIQALFQQETSTVITATFLFLLLALDVAAFTKLVRSGFNRELAFILLLLGEFISMFLALSLQYGITLRYWSVLVPCLAALLAFAAKFLLEATKRRKMLANCVALALTAFATFFVSANYHNFLYQVVVWHSARNLDDLVTAEIAQLLNSGKYVQGNPHDWHFEEMASLELPQIHNEHWPNAPEDSRSVHRVPPMDPRQPYYFLDIGGQPALAASAQSILVGRTDYDVLDYAARAASLLQGGAPHLSLDWGVQELGKYSWAIYSLPHNMADYLKELTSEAGEPVSDSFFDVHYDGEKLTYVRNPCEERDIEEWFFLHFVPHDKANLPAESKRWGFVNWDFHFRDWGVKDGNVCVVVRQLPRYRLSWITTGQYPMDGGPRIWETEFHTH